MTSSKTTASDRAAIDRINDKFATRGTSPRKDDVDDAAFTAVCAAVAVLHPELPLRDVERIATELGKGERVAYAALCVVSGSVTQEGLTELVESTTDWADFVPRRGCPGGYDYAGHDCGQSPECQTES